MRDIFRYLMAAYIAICWVGGCMLLGFMVGLK